MTELRVFLEGADSDEEAGKKKQGIMQRVGSLDARQFDGFLKQLYSDGYLRLVYHRLREREEQLREKGGFSELENVVVVAGSDPGRFAQAAGEDFIKRMCEIAQRKAPAVLNVGIVSGRTTGAVVRAMRDMDWTSEVGVNAHDLQKVRVLPLNVCLTVPQHLAGNATILTYQFAEKINAEANREIAEAYGLSAPLIVEKQRLAEVDEAPQIFDVLRFTEPYRVQRKLQKLGMLDRPLEPTDTELDLVLTGVGERKPERGPGSIWYGLAKEFGFDMDDIIERERILGDIAFVAIRGDGEPVVLRGLKPMDTAKETESRQAGAGSEYVFYSAVQLPVLEAMAEDKNKSVILVARYEEGKYKIPAIFAAIAGGRHRYVSRLVIDEKTAGELLRY